MFTLEEAKIAQYLEVRPLTIRVISKRIGKDRIEADHKVTDPAIGECNFVKNFVVACQDFISAGNSFECKLQQIEIT